MGKSWKLFSTFGLLVLIILGLLRGDMLYLIVVTFLFVAQLVLWGSKLFHPIFFFLFPFIALFYLMGDILGFYDAGTEYDAVLHFLADFMMTLLFGTILLKINKIKGSFIYTLLIFGVVLGVGWEIFEWWAGQYFPQDLVGDINDTTSDVILDTLGSILAIILIKNYINYFKKI